MKNKKSSVENYLFMESLPEKDPFNSLLTSACSVLSSEDEAYRPENCIGESGSLLFFKNDLPAVIVPDIHARPDFIKNILKYTLPKDFLENQNEELTIQKALELKLINVICVGDAIHSEVYAERWRLIQEDFESGDCTSDLMKDEMLLCLSTLCSILSLKTEYPQNFHFLKGNHENIMNTSFGGDYAFRKYADEGEMVKTFIENYYDQETLENISMYENLLPLVAAGENYVVSHAEPADFYTKEQLIDAKFEENVVEGLTWTNNNQVTEKTAEYIIKELLGEDKVSVSSYFAGHRPVREKYALRQNGTFIQLHNPRQQNIALVYKNRRFNPEMDIVNTREDNNGK